MNVHVVLFGELSTEAMLTNRLVQANNSLFHVEFSQVESLRTLENFSAVHEMLFEDLLLK